MAATVVQIVEVVIGAKDLYSAQLKAAKRAFSKFSSFIGKRIKIGAASATVAIGALAAAMWKATAAASRLSQQSMAFDNLAASVGANSDKIIDDLKRVSANTVSTADIITSAGKALLLGLPAEQLTKMMEIARAAARITGDTIQKSFDDIATGMGRQSKLILDNLGIVFDATKANELYAEQLNKTTAELTDADRKQAFYNATLLAGERIISNVGVQSITFSERISQVKAGFVDLVSEIGNIIVKSNFFNQIINQSSGIFAGWAQQIKDNRLFLMALAKDAFGAIVSGVGTALEVMRFFHNGWLGIKLAIAAVALVASDTLRFINEAIRFILTPLDLIFDAAVKLGTIDVNPFDSMIAGTIKLQVASREMGAGILEDIEIINGRYDAATQTVKNFQETIAGFKAEELAGPEAGAGVAAPEEEESPVIKLAREEADKIIAIQAAKFQRLGAMAQEFGLSEEERANLEAFRQLEELEADLVRIEEDEIAKKELKDQFLQAEIDILSLHQAKLTEIQAKEEAKRLKGVKKTEKMTADAKRKGFGMASKFLNNLFVATNSHSKSMFKVMKVFAIAQAVVDGKAAAVGAYKIGASIGGPPLGSAFAAAAIAATGAQIAQINATQMAAGGGSAAGGGETTTPAIPTPGIEPDTNLLATREEETRTTQEVNIVIQGEVVTAETIGKLAEPIFEMINKAGQELDLKINVEALEVERA